MLDKKIGWPVRESNPDVPKLIIGFTLEITLDKHSFPVNFTRREGIDSFSFYEKIKMFPKVGAMQRHLAAVTARYLQFIKLFQATSGT